LTAPDGAQGECAEETNRHERGNSKTHIPVNLRFDQTMLLRSLRPPKCDMLITLHVDQVNQKNFMPL